MDRHDSRTPLDPDDRVENDGHPDADGEREIAEAIAGALRPAVEAAAHATSAAATGAGEPPVHVIALAVVNAFFRLTGLRYRNLPLALPSPGEHAKINGVIGRPLALTLALSWAASAVLFDPLDPRMNARAPETFRVRFQTSRGDFVVEGHRSWAPIGADRFYNLARHHFFDGQRFFRVRAHAFAQFGVPGDPQLARAWRNATIADDPVHVSNERGTLAYAFTTPETRATQIFINLRDNRQYDAEGFAPFGRVISGMLVVDAFYAGYGEGSGGGMRAGHQDELFAEGNAWLDRNFPKLDSIIRARLIEIDTSPRHNARP